MSKLLLVNPSIRESSEPKHVPLGELLIAACAEEWVGAQTGLLDLNAMRSVLRPRELDEEIELSVQEENWDIVGIGGITTTYSSIKHALKLMRPLTDATIILGGGGFTAQPYEWMRWLPEADIGVFGEAVQTVCTLMEAQHGGYPLPAGVNGIFYRENGKIRRTVERPMIADMDKLPLPKYDLAPLDIYFKNSSILLSEESMTANRRLDYAASMGCSLSCRFCFGLGLDGFAYRGEEVIFPRSHPELVPRLNRWRSPELCVKDWKYMRDKYGCDFIALLDENLMTMNAVRPVREGETWIEEISRRCIESGLQPSCIREGKSHDATCEGGVHFGGTCVTSDSIIYTPRGPVRMDTLTIGDAVLSWQPDKGSTESRVLKVWSNGIKPTFRVSTNYRNIVCTANHPFCVIRTNGKRGDARRVTQPSWVRADKLRSDDYILTLTTPIDGFVSVGESMARLAGYVIGDGWLTVYGHTWQLCLSRGDGVTSEDYIQRAASLFNANISRSHSKALRICSKRACEKMIGLGVDQPHNTAIMPHWVYAAALHEKLAFIDGLLDADGTIDTENIWQIELASEQLVIGLKILCDMTGLHTGRIIHRERKIKVPSTGKVVDAKSWSMTINRNRNVSPRGRRAFMQHAIDAYGLVAEKFLAISKVGVAEVFDCEIEKTHCFAANGMVVHNSHASLVTPRALKAMKAMGFSYLDYGYEAWDDRILKWVRKGASVKTNVRSLIMTMRYGIRPVPNNITGFEPEDFESIRRMMVAWEVLGIVVMPFLFTPYPGADIWYRNKEKILAEYGGDMELFIKTLNDATEPVVSISENFTLQDILVYRFHMVKQDKDAIDQFENAWRKKRGLPPRSREEQQADWVKFRAEVQRYANEAKAEQYEVPQV